MSIIVKRFTPVLLFLFAVFMVIGFSLEDADARSRGGGRSFSRSRTYKAPVQRTPTTRQTTPGTRSSGGFMRGLAGGMVGGAIGSLLFGSLAHGAGGGLGGSGIGLFQILIFAGVGYFIYRRFFRKPSAGYPGQHSMPGTGAPFGGGMTGGAGETDYSPSAPSGTAGSMEDGIDMIRHTEPDFDPEYFKEVAQDVFFKVQAGWMRRELQSYRHLLGDQLAKEYEGHFAEMSQKGHINKLESIAIRKVEMTDAGVENNEEFMTILFTANLLDYTVDDKSGDLVSGSMTDPVKFAEKWTWARPGGAENWKLEGIDVV